MSTGGQTNEEIGTKSAIYVASALNRTLIKPVFTNTHLWTGDKRTHTGIPANVRINFETHQDVRFGTLLNWKENCRYPDDYVVFLASHKYNNGRKWDIAVKEFGLGEHLLNVTGSDDLHIEHYNHPIVNFIPSDEQLKGENMTPDDLLDAWKASNKKCAILMNIFRQFRGHYKSKFQKRPKCCNGNGSTMPVYVKSIVKEFEKFQNIELRNVVGIHWRWNKREVLTKEQEMQKSLGLRNL